MSPIELRNKSNFQRDKTGLFSETEMYCLSDESKHLLKPMYSMNSILNNRPPSLAFPVLNSPRFLVSFIGVPSTNSSCFQRVIVYQINLAT